MRRRLYFAYGSNLNVRQMRVRCPDAELAGPAVLENWRLTFRGVADVVPAEGQRVIGALWWVSDRDLAALDRYEGYPVLYGRRRLDIEAPEGPARALVYFMKRGGAEMAPSPGYLQSIVEGYRACGLDTDQLLKALKTVGRRMRDAGVTKVVIDGKRTRPYAEPKRATRGMTLATQLELGLADPR